MQIIKHGKGRIDIMPSVSLVFDEDDLTKTDIVECYDCRIAHTYVIVVTLPTFHNAVTATFTIKDPSGATIYSQAGLVNSSVNVWVVERPLVDGSVLGVLLDGVAGGTGGTVHISGSLIHIE